MMWKYGASEAGRLLAEAKAQEEKLCHGWSAFGGGYYVGTAEELSAIGVVTPLCAIARDFTGTGDDT